jgi:hypothetical protein
MDVTRPPIRPGRHAIGRASHSPAGRNAIRPEQSLASSVGERLSYRK